MYITIYYLRKYGFAVLLILASFTFSNLSIGQNAASGMQASEFNTSNLSEFLTPITYGIESYHELNAKHQEHPEFGLLPKNRPCDDCFELLEKRTINSRYFVNAFDTSKFYLQTAFGDLHHEKDGKLISLDHHVVKKGNRYISDFYTNPTEFLLESQKVKMGTPETNLFFNNWQLYKRSNGNYTHLSEPNWNNWSIGDDGLYIREIFPGIDAEMIVLRGSIKTNFIIKRNEFGNFDALIFRDKIETENQNVLLSFEDAPNQTIGFGNILIQNDQLNSLAIYKEGLAYPKNGTKEMATNLAYQISQNELDIIVNKNFIDEYINDYELVIDPIVTGSNTLAQAAITGSMYNTSCNFTNSCNHNLTVAAPANAVFQDVTWSFDYIAQGICWLDDGATRFATGTCVSPGQTGFYWFCNSPQAGNCSGNNISIWNDLQTCMPPPSCNTQNIDFTMQFFRRCYGSTGCANDCIGANSPWTITIEGQTIEYNSLVNPITASTTTVCQGQTVNVNTLATGGVPPYNYNWSFDPSGTPSVGTGQTSTITFPNSGTIPLYSIITDNCGNQIVESININVTPSPALTVTATVEDICEGDQTTINVTGGTTYNWDNGLGGGDTHIVSPTTTTTYNVTSGGGTGCSASGNVTIEVTPTPIFTVTGTNPSGCGTNDGSITISGLTPNETFGISYNNGTTQTYITNGSGQITISNLAPGIYTDFEAETNGCDGNNSNTITLTEPVNPIVDAGVDQTICSNSQLTLTAGNPNNANITWNNNVQDGIAFSPPLGTNIYTVTADLNGCISTDEVEITVIQTPTISTSFSNPTTCGGGEGSITISGLLPNEVFDLTYNGMANINITSDANGEYVISNLTAGTYNNITVIYNNCASDLISPVVLNDPSPPGVSAGSNQSICEGDAITLIAGNPDNANISWNNAVQDGISFTPPLGTNNYTVTAELNNCTSTDQTTVTVNPVPNPTVNATAITACGVSNGSIELSNLLNNQNYQISINGNTPSTISTTATGNHTINNLNGGTYQIEITALGCSTTVSATVNGINGPLIESENISHESCFNENDGAITVNVGQGTPPFIYTWVPNIGSTSSVNGLSPGNYELIIVDGAGCSINKTYTINAATPINAVADISDSFCSDEDGSINLTVNGGTGNYSFEWSDGSTTNDLTNLPAGIFEVTISDNNGCTYENSYTVNQTGLLNINAFPPVSTIMYGDSTTLFVDTIPNTPNLIYEWFPPDGLSCTDCPNPSLSPEETTTYEIFVLNEDDGCFGIDSVTIFVEFPCIPLQLPTIFSPNGDGQNDKFCLLGDCYTNAKITIFNRWGEVIFKGEDFNDCWNGTYKGKYVDLGVYTYKVLYTDEFGVQQSFGGNVNVVR